MTAQLMSLITQKFWSNTGQPLPFGYAYTYAAGTRTPQAAYAEYTQTVQNGNPIALNARGEAQIWFDPLLNYKIQGTDSICNQVGNVVGNIQGAIASNVVSISIGGNVYIGSNSVPVLNGGMLAYYPQALAEISVSILPLAFQYPVRHRALHASVNASSGHCDDRGHRLRRPSSTHRSISSCAGISWACGTYGGPAP